MTVDIRIETVLSDKLSMGQNRSFFRHYVQNNDQGELPASIDQPSINKKEIATAAVNKSLFDYAEATCQPCF